MNRSSKNSNTNKRSPSPSPLARRPFLLSDRIKVPTTSSHMDNGVQEVARSNAAPKATTCTTTKLGTTQENEETAAPCESNESATPYSSCCCGKVKIQMGCHIVGISSLLATISNATLYFFGVPRLGLSGTFEVILLAADFFTVLSLFLGLLKHRAGLMKPYILFNSLWILSLCLLLTVCLWKLAKGSDLPNNILSNLRSLRSHTTDDEHDHTQQMHHSIAVPSEGPDSSLVTAAVMVGLVIVIIVDGFFLHVVYRTFCFFAYLESKRKEETFGQLTTTTL